MEVNKLSVNQEREELRQRCIAGNAKLNEAWERIKKMDISSQAWADAMEKWGQANAKLRVLCLRLEVLGYDICLYYDDEGYKTKTCLQEGDIGCRVCPSHIHYWENELMNLPSANQPVKVKKVEEAPGAKLL